ncbi:MAG: PilZ domain-containing protein [Treponema sp.]|nr:PilZ domain-containing protein [Treponema sp.]MBR0126149.1 PilZ domain-containing protein [Treponema sp.]MBR0477377.1 PilZ domain-containing protein [Treponema sp.]
MAVLTSQQIGRYYEEYRDTEIAFTKDIMHTLALDPRQIYIKCTGNQWPCIINSTSFAKAKIIIGTKGSAFQQLARRDAPAVNLRYCFYQNDGQMMTFLISGKIGTISSYMNSRDLAVLEVIYTQKPPDDFIEKIGHLIDANANAIKRKEDRIVLTPDSCRKLGIPKEESIISIQNVPRHCILRDLSFGGAKVLLLGLPQFLKDKEVLLNLEFDEPHEIINLRGRIVSTSEVEGRKDIVAANIQFSEESVTLSYKIHINNYLTSVRKNELDASAKEMQNQADSQGASNN